MTTIIFPVRKATRNLSFCCTKCGKKRSRKLTEECTVNPWNRDPATGTPLTPDEVQKQADTHLAGTVALFLAEPVCRSCENEISWEDMKLLRERRERAVSGLP